MAHEVLYLGNDNLIQVVGLKDVAAGTYANTASIVATLKDANGNAVAGASNLTVAYVAGSNGNYNGTIVKTVVLIEGSNYALFIDATLGSILGHWELACVGRVRRN